jgi:hypothetical protein
MRAPVVYYSLTGTTRRVAQALAAELDADVEEIRCPRYRRGFFGFWRAAHASWKCKIPEVAAQARPQGLRACSGWRSGLGVGRVHAGPCLPDARGDPPPGSRPLRDSQGVGLEKALATMEALADRKPAATLVLRTEDFKRGRGQVAISSFAAALGRSKTA